MRFALLVAAGLSAAFVVAAPAATKPATRGSQSVDWSRSFAVTPDGGFRMGNPKARVAIVEYGSLTCPHCRHFTQTAMKPLLAGYVRTGRATYEFRPLVLNGIDLAATLVARCGGPSRFFPIAEELYATQPTWAGRITDAQQQKLQAMPEGQMMLNIARITGVTRIAAGHGVPIAVAERCAKDEAAAQRLADMADAANGKGVDGAPTFFVNGERVAAHDWPTLEPFLKKAGG